MENALINIFELPDINSIGYEAKLLLANETYNKIMYISEIYNKAEKDGIDTNDFDELIDYIKKNKITEEKQINIIRKKLIRCKFILNLYNNEKYKHIQDFIQRIHFSTKAVAKLDNNQWHYFKDNLIHKLNNELNNFNNENVIIEKNDNKNNIIDIDDMKKDKCIKCSKLCQVEDCQNKKHSFGNTLLEYCIKHTRLDLNL